MLVCIMRYQFFLLLTLVVCLSTGLFAVTHIIRLANQRNVVVGSWNNDGSEVVFDSLESKGVGERVLGATTENFVIASAPRTEVKSYKGYLFDLYLAQNRSPLYGYGDEFVKACKKYDTPEDCTLLLAIGKVETNLCRTDISARQYNCWGWGGSGSNRILFSSFPQAIDTITGRLKTGYGDRFFNNPSNGALSYCGAHCTSWGRHVQSERERINAFFIANGHPALF